MGYWTIVRGTLRCNDLKRAKEILDGRPLFDPDEITFDEETKICVCPLCGNEHQRGLNIGSVHISGTVRDLDPEEDFGGLSEICEGELYCHGESPDDIYKIEFKDGKMRILKPKWEVLKG